MTIWFISDTHFGHENMITRFVLPDGSPARKFASVEEMDELMIANWNAVVRPSDHIYHLGDVAMRQQDLDRIMPRLNGHKRLIRGNHDIFKTKQYLRWFEEIHGMRVLDNMVFTHVPLAPWSMGRFLANVHGHVHHNRPQTYTVKGEYRAQLDDLVWGAREEFTSHYVNLSVERTDYAPVTLETVKAWVLELRAGTTLAHT